MNLIQRLGPSAIVFSALLCGSISPGSFLLRSTAASDVVPIISQFAVIPGLAGIATSNGGDIYTISRTEHCIYQISHDGTISSVIGPALPSGFILEFSQDLGTIPLHVDSKGHIYVWCRGRLLVLDTSGHILNVDSDGKVPLGFNLAFVKWIGTTADGNIYVYPSVDDKFSLVSVLSPTGKHLSPLGDVIFDRRAYESVFRPVLTDDGTLFAFSAIFPLCVRYSLSGQVDRWFKLPLPSTLETLVAMNNMPFEEAFKKLLSGGPKRITKSTIVFTDAELLGASTFLCMTGDMQLCWYNTDGQLLKSYDLYQGLLKAGMVGRLIRYFAVVPGGKLALAVDERNGALISINLVEAYKP